MKNIWIFTWRCADTGKDQQSDSDCKMCHCDFSKGNTPTGCRSKTPPFKYKINTPALSFGCTFLVNLWWRKTFLRLEKLRLCPSLHFKFWFGMKRFTKFLYLKLSFWYLFVCNIIQSLSNLVSKVKQYYL